MATGSSFLAPVEVSLFFFAFLFLNHIQVLSYPRNLLTQSTGLGHLATQIASRGIGLRVIGIDAGSKRALVLDSGAEHFIDFAASQDVALDVKKLTGGLGAHAVVVLTAANGAYAM